MMTSNLRNAIVSFVHELDTSPPYLFLVIGLLRITQDYCIIAIAVEIKLG